MLKDRKLCRKPARSDNLVLIQSKLPLVNIGEEDQPVWNASGKGVYSNANTWEALRVKHPKVPWWILIWFSIAIPKQASVHWLAVRDALATGRKMMNWGYKEKC